MGFVRLFDFAVLVVSEVVSAAFSAVWLHVLFAATSMSSFGLFFGSFWSCHDIRPSYVGVLLSFTEERILFLMS
jgi:hypothetical protein